MLRRRLATGNAPSRPTILPESLRLQGTRLTPSRNMSPEFRPNRSNRFHSCETPKWNDSVSLKGSYFNCGVPRGFTVEPHITKGPDLPQNRKLSPSRKKPWTEALLYVESRRKPRNTLIMPRASNSACSSKEPGFDDESCSLSTIASSAMRILVSAMIGSGSCSASSRADSHAPIASILLSNFFRCWVRSRGLNDRENVAREQKSFNYRFSCR